MAFAYRKAFYDQFHNQMLEVEIIAVESTPILFATVAICWFIKGRVWRSEFDRQNCSVIMRYLPGDPVAQVADMRPQHHRTSTLDADSWVTPTHRVLTIYFKRFAQDEDISMYLPRWWKVWSLGRRFALRPVTINLSSIEVSTTLAASVYQQMTVAADNKPLIRNLLASLFYSTNINVPAVSHVHYGTRAYLLAAASTPKSESHFFNERSYDDVVTRS